MTESDVAKWLVQFDPAGFERWCDEQDVTPNPADETIVRRWAASFLAPSERGVTVPADASESAHR